ncbi:MAG TPA: phosphoesterase [Lachnoclostridium phytofermentans]|uniref:Phosphoesterase n=1 Tax=Lachnoclostridium phytofermentans TaxID=66219 RepID=A0A3D2X9C3_9FIRM|nr:phosphoesterase [Lachnoclostridium phytofermentans]
MKRLKIKHVFIVVFFIILSVFIIVAFDTRLTTKFYTIQSDKITEQVRIVLITDLHSCQYGTDQLTLIEAIKKQNPDIILLGGDICDDVIPNDNTEFLLKGIANQYKCYYVTGNHEYWSNEIDKIFDLFLTYDVKILNGTYDTIDIHGQKINICGIDDPDVLRYTNSTIDVTEQLESLKYVYENGYYTVLLAHRPEMIAEYTTYNFDLVLSGHAHGGQWRLPGIINGLYAPNQGLFPPYAGGEYIIDDAVLIVSRGLAKESTRLPRIFNRPELVVIDLVKPAKG